MGLFFNYNKPGPGVDKNAPKKKGIFRYFEIFGRKLGKLIQLNMLYFLCSLPMLLVCYFYFAPTIIDMFQRVAATESGISQDTVITYQAMITLLLTVLSVTVLGSGPASAAAAYIERCFVREQHVWLISDFFAKYKENFKQGIIVSVVGIIVSVTGFFSIRFYFMQYASDGKGIWFVLMVLLVIFLMIFSGMHYYIYQLMVTFENNLINLYKNALLLTLSTLPVLLLITIAVAVIAYFLYTILAPVLTMILSFVFVLQYLRFPFEFYAASVIQKKILDTLPSEDSAEELSDSDNYSFSETDTADLNRSDN